MKNNNKILLPAGFHDVLPPDAGLEARVVFRLLSNFARYGYEQVKPPLMEFEKTLISDKNKELSNQTFRVIDPVSQETIAIRADMTTQIIRIASTRMADEPLPLRICYSGQVLRVKGSGLYAERQLAQVGLELIGSSSPEADAEVVAIAAESLARLKIKGLSVDFNLPSLARLLLDEYGVKGNNAEQLLELINRKDTTGIRDLGNNLGELILQLISAAGPAKRALAKIDKIKLPGRASAHVKYLKQVISQIAKSSPTLEVTIDPLEHKGFEYHSGISFSLFAKGSPDELGRGGRYRIEDVEASGFTLYLNNVIRALPKFKSKEKLYVPFGVDCKKAMQLRMDGYITVQGLEAVKNVEKEARRLGCGMLLNKGKVVRIR